MAYLDKTTGLFLPGNSAGGNSGGGSGDFYLCAEVFGPSKVSGFIVSGAGTAAVNGNYLPTDLKTEEDTPIYKHETAEYYYFEMWGEKGICTRPTQYPSEGLYYNMYDEGWAVGSGAHDAPTVNKGNIILNAEAPKTWNGHKAVWSDENGYSFEQTLTTGLSYERGFTPEVGNIYDGNATVIVANLCKFISGRSVITLYTPREPGIDGTYKQVAGTEYGTKECRWQYTRSDYPTRNIHWGTPTAGGSYGDDSYVGVEGWHVFDGENENKVWLGNGAFPTAPTHWDANSTLTETVEDWE